MKNLICRASLWFVFTFTIVSLSFAEGDEVGSDDDSGHVSLSDAIASVKSLPDSFTGKRSEDWILKNSTFRLATSSGLLFHGVKLNLGYSICLVVDATQIAEDVNAISPTSREIGLTSLLMGRLVKEDPALISGDLRRTMIRRELLIPKGEPMPDRLEELIKSIEKWEMERSKVVLSKNSDDPANQRFRAQ